MVFSDTLGGAWVQNNALLKAFLEANMCEVGIAANCLFSSGPFACDNGWRLVQWTWYLSDVGYGGTFRSTSLIPFGTKIGFEYRVAQDSKAVILSDYPVFPLQG